MRKKPRLNYQIPKSMVARKIPKLPMINGNNDLNIRDASHWPLRSIQIAPNCANSSRFMYSKSHNVGYVTIVMGFLHTNTLPHASLSCGCIHNCKYHTKPKVISCKTVVRLRMCLCTLRFLMLCDCNQMN